MLPAFALIAACSSSKSTSNDGGTINFGDSSTPPPHDSGKPKDSGHKDTGGGKPDATDGATDAPSDAPTDAVKDVVVEGAGPMTPCTAPSQCASGVCEPKDLVGTNDGGAVHFDAGVCALTGEAGVMCQCQGPSCVDGVKNGHETGIDCGGGACPACGVGSGCISGTDCAAKECGIGYKGGKCTGASPDAGPDASPGDASGEGGAEACVCEAASCSDGVQNQDETDVDCGGATCNKCPTGKECKVPTDCSSTVCTNTLCACPAGMTEAPTASSVPYCIDTYEVTFSQYSTFVGSANKATIDAQPSYCSWNTGFVPASTPDGNWPEVGQAAMNPVNGVNWCDAYAYCSAVGKHLCGAIKTVTTPGGAPIALGAQEDAGILQANDPSVDEWYNACSSQGQTIYPYGNSYSGLCNTIDSAAQRSTGFVESPPGQAGYTIETGGTPCVLDTECEMPVIGLSSVAQGETVSCHLFSGVPMSMPACGAAFQESGCVGGSSTNVIYDLAGNLAEWENSCDGTAGANDNCALRGGSFDSTPGNTSTTCASSSAQPPMARQTQSQDIGFRCCL